MTLFLFQKISSAITSSLLTFADSIHHLAGKCLRLEVDTNTRVREDGEYGGYFSNVSENQYNFAVHHRLLVLLSDAETMRKEICPKLMRNIGISENSPEWQVLYFYFFKNPFFQEVILVYNDLCDLLFDHYTTLRAVPLAAFIRQGIITHGAYWTAQTNNCLHFLFYCL